MRQCPRCSSRYDDEVGFCPRDGSPLEEVSEDDLIGQGVGRYRITERIGQGGMGAVYLAVHPGIGSRVAVKVLHPELARDRAAVDRFFAEARSVNLIRHESIVNILDLAKLPDGRSYIVMEYLEGESLAARLRRSGALPPRKAMQTMLPVLSALNAAHEHGIIHRDLKPDNIYLTRGGQVKVLDFGIAKLDAAHGGGSATRTGAILGTPLYMSPEQAAGRTSQVDRRSDIYSAGIILYELLTGQVPFVAEGLYDLITMHLKAPPPPLRPDRPDISPELEQIVLRALAKDREGRFASAGEMADALETALELAGATADGAVVGAGVAAAALTPPATTPATTPAAATPAPATTPAAATPAPATTPAAATPVPATTPAAATTPAPAVMPVPATMPVAATPAPTTTPAPLAAPGSLEAALPSTTPALQASGAPAGPLSATPSAPVVPGAAPAMSASATPAGPMAMTPSGPMGGLPPTTPALPASGMPQGQLAVTPSGPLGAPPHGYHPGRGAPATAATQPGGTSRRGVSIGVVVALLVVGGIVLAAMHKRLPFQKDDDKDDKGKVSVTLSDDEDDEVKVSVTLSDDKDDAGVDEAAGQTAARAGDGSVELAVADHHAAAGAREVAAADPKGNRGVATKGKAGRKGQKRSKVGEAEKGRKGKKGEKVVPGGGGSVAPSGPDRRVGGRPGGQDPERLRELASLRELSRLGRKSGSGEIYRRLDQRQSGTKLKRSGVAALDIGGLYSGRIRNRTVNQGTTGRLLLKVTGNRVSGFLTVDPPLGGSGPVVGTASGGTLRMQVISNDGVILIRGVVLGKTLTGSYRVGNQHGTFLMRKP